MFINSLVQTGGVSYVMSEVSFKHVYKVFAAGYRGIAIILIGTQIFGFVVCAISHAVR